MTSEHVDVVVVGAGLSGIGAGYHLQTMCPDRSYVILEGRDSLGGTWDLFKYPGVRSDSDMHTLGFSFKPWTEAKSIADGPSILKYLKETVSQFGIDQHIRYGQLVTKAQWSTDDAQWTVTSTNKATGATNSYTCSFLFMCSGYYSYKKGHTPEFTGRERFKGTIVHPQEWPTDLDYSGKRVVVIGSGATAVTIVPSMADKAAHVTMLQRSPTYMVSRPDHDVLFARQICPTGAGHLKGFTMVSIPDFRNGMSLLTGAVNVITTDGAAGLAGFTASAVCSVTDQPPTLLVCMNRSSFAHRFFVENRSICANVLSAAQQDLSALFANRDVTMADRFAQVAWLPLSTGAPALEGALVNFDGIITHIHDVGSHSIFITELRDIRLPAESAQGLAYFNRAYHRLGEAQASA